MAAPCSFGRGGAAHIYDLADWIFRLTHGGVSPATALAGNPFPSEEGLVWSIGPVPLVSGFTLRR